MIFKGCRYTFQCEDTEHDLSGMRVTAMDSAPADGDPDDPVSCKTDDNRTVLAYPRELTPAPALPVAFKSPQPGDRFRCIKGSEDGFFGEEGKVYTFCRLDRDDFIFNEMPLKEVAVDPRRFQATDDPASPIAGQPLPSHTSMLTPVGWAAVLREAPADLMVAERTRRHNVALAEAAVKDAQSELDDAISQLAAAQRV